MGLPEPIWTTFIDLLQRLVAQPIVYSNKPDALLELPGTCASYMGLLAEYSFKVNFTSG